MSETLLDFIAAQPFASPNAQARIDIVFIHGLGGDRVMTWTHGTPRDDGFWPKWLADDLSEANIWTVGYDSGLFAKALTGEGPSLSDRATVLMDYLIASELGQRNIAFVTHSLGGLIVKQMLRKCADSGNAKRTRFLDSVKGVAFLGTPHQGASLAATVNSILGLIVSKNVKDLCIGNDALIDLNDWFRTKSAIYGMQVASYYETYNTKGLRIVDQITANPGVLGCDPIAVEGDHISMCKPSSRQAPVYVGVRAFLRDLISSCPPSPPAGSQTQGNGPTTMPPTPTQLAAPTTDGFHAYAPAKRTEQEVAPDIQDDYDIYTNIAAEDRRTLAQKMAAAGRGSQIGVAEHSKERFMKALRRHIAQPSAITRYTKVMAAVERRFSRWVEPAILDGAPKLAIDHLVQDHVIDPIVAQHQTPGAELSEAIVDGALYYLTGNCHIRWDNGQA
ncbi:ABC-three component system protein [Azospirillum tabaci]|uniref:ABC-three component system protein n=1 Tax=Azospirillum tabaci TaxID=2752310 RepID=UPI0016601AF1|nr:ABC-three component system protein [Azospirillum tabaci]